MMADLLRRLDPAITVLIIEHDMDIALEIAQHVTVLHYGRVIADGPGRRSRPTRWCARSTSVLEIADVHTYYGESHVLHGVSLAVGPGEIVTDLGRNGMGKTTLIRSVIGFTPARRGTIRFKGEDITRWPPFRAVEHGMGLVPQGRRVFPSLTVRENLEVAARGNGGRWTLAKVPELFPRLQERAGNRANKPSGGEQAMLAIGPPLVTNPRLPT